MIKFAGSYSRLKNFETCPKRHYHYDLAPWNERIKDGESQPLKWGNAVHEALAATVEKGIVLPDDKRKYQVFVDRLVAGEGETLVEQSYAFTRDLTACGYKDPEVFWRTRIDVIQHLGPAAIVWDWKTGKRKIEEDQLMISATAVFAHLPEVQGVMASFVWVEEPAEDAVIGNLYLRKDMAKHWADMMPRVKKMELAYQKEEFPATPSGLCKNYCGVVSCIYHGAGSLFPIKGSR